MPTSNLSVAPHVINLVETVDPHDRVLDVGPGWGKYATLLREYLNRKPARIDAVEAWEPYIRQHHLTRLYNQVWHGAAGDDRGAAWVPADGKPPKAGRPAGLVVADYDMVLMVDVIEHMSTEAATRFLRMCPQARAVICTPEEFFHNGTGLPPTEDHVSHWPPATMKAFAYSLGRPVEHLELVHGAVLSRLGPAR